jgi:hypothetical protein
MTNQKSARFIESDLIVAPVVKSGGLGRLRLLL